MSRHSTGWMSEHGEEEFELRAADGARLYGRCVPGRGRGLVLCVHGLGSNLTRFSEFVELTDLRPEFTLLRIDLRGHGRSPWRGPLNMGAWCDDLAALLHTHARAPALVIGHSFGAVVALHLALRHPDAVAGLVLIEPTLRCTLRRRWRLLLHAGLLLRLALRVVRLLNAVGLRRRHYAYRDLRLWDRTVREELLAHGRHAEMVRLYESVRVDLRYNPLATLLAGLAELLRPLPVLAGVRQPVLVLRATGAPDPMPELAPLPRLSMRSIPGAHWLLTESPETTRAAIEEFCRAHALAPAG